MAALNPYLTFNDNCEEAFNFYKSVFGGEFAMLMRFETAPSSPEMPLDPSESQKIMHVALPIGKGSVLMGSDSPAAFGGVKVGTNLSISISVDSREEADKLYNGLSAGGKATMPMADAFWGDYFGMLDDKYGVAWLVSFGKMD